MTQTDRDRLVALKKARDKKITQRQAAEELKVTERHIRRLMRAMKRGGDAALVHRLRGRKSNRLINSKQQNRALKILSQDIYRGFGPTLASEYLRDEHNIRASKETVRKWMSQAGLWSPTKQSNREIHVWRKRRERCGELVQWDTSEHDWLEGRGEKVIWSR